MLLQPKIHRAAATDIGLDQARLYRLGLNQVRRLSSQLWTDHNTHDPGITILELLCYALTDLTYRAQLPLEDLLATPTANAATMSEQFFTPRQVLFNRPLTTTDYRKLIIDLPGVKNAWLRPASIRYVADAVAAKLRHDNPSKLYESWERPVDIRGLYDVLLEYMDNVKTEAERAAVHGSARVLLEANRNLCEDFRSIAEVKIEAYSLCAELELAPDANPSLIEAQLRFAIDNYLAPPVQNYSLADMLAKPKPDGSRRAVPEVFDGPVLMHGFIDDAELAASELRTEIRLSDIVSVIMDIDGVQAVRDIVVNALGPDGKATVPPNKWRLKVTAGMQPRLSAVHGRLVFYKRNLPVLADPAKVKKECDALKATVRAKLEQPNTDDVRIPLGRFRDTGRYFSFQNHFPSIYGLSEAGLPGNADMKREAAALQLKGYLLFFDQVMANYLAQLAKVRDLFSRKPANTNTYFVQVVDSFREYHRIYPDKGDSPNELQLPHVEATLAELLEKSEAALRRRESFLDHLLARFAEDFKNYASILQSAFGAGLQTTVAAKSAFMDDYLNQKQGSERGLAYNHSLTTPDRLWDSTNVSGLERRLAMLLEIKNVARRNLAETPPEFSEGMFLIENILLRPTNRGDDAFLSICVDPGCVGCFDDDPYSYRLHVVLPAYAGRFRNLEFRRFVEETIRLEAPAHTLPKICWVGAEAMKNIEQAYHEWLLTRADSANPEQQKKRTVLIDALREAKNVYLQQKLHGCDSSDDKPPFILNRNSLGSATA